METICVDTNLLIDYFRKKDKSETRLFKLAKQYQICLPAIVVYEYLRGGTKEASDEFLDKLLASVTTLPFDFNCARTAADIWQKNKISGKTIEPEDLLIAATAIAGKYPLATLNSKHFEYIEHIQLL